MVALDQSKALSRGVSAPSRTLKSREEVAITDTHMIFRLDGTGLPDGQIGLIQLAALAEALQSLATRIGRHAIEQEGPGRTFAAAEDVTRLRLVGLSEGSTTLAVEYGQPGVLDLEVPIETQTRRRFEEVIQALGASSRPAWVPDPVAEAAAALLEALDRAAESVEFTSVEGTPMTFSPARAARSVWRPRTSTSDEVVAAAGRLEAVDLKAHRFRIRDDVGNAIVLSQVQEDALTASLIGRRVIARGQPVLGENGGLARIESPTVQAASLPGDWTAGSSGHWTEELAKPGADSLPPLDVSDEEFDALMAALRDL